MGTKRVGISISDESHSIAFSYSDYIRKHRNIYSGNSEYKYICIDEQKHATNFFQDIINKENVRGFIIGLPIQTQYRSDDPNRISTSLNMFSYEIIEFAQSLCIDDIVIGIYIYICVYACDFRCM